MSNQPMTNALITAIQQADKKGRGVDFRELQYGFLAGTKQRKNKSTRTAPALEIRTRQKGKVTKEQVSVVATYIGGGVQTHTGDVFFPKKDKKGSWFVNCEVIKMPERNMVEV